jgi:hypothetical protein
MSMQEAKDLHADITRLLLQLQNLQEIQQKSVQDDLIQVEITGGKF